MTLAPQAYTDVDESSSAGVYVSLHAYYTMLPDNSDPLSFNYTDEHVIAFKSFSNKAKNK